MTNLVLFFWQPSRRPSTDKVKTKAESPPLKASASDIPVQDTNQTPVHPLRAEGLVFRRGVPWVRTRDRRRARGSLMPTARDQREQQLRHGMNRERREGDGRFAGRISTGADSPRLISRTSSPKMPLDKAADQSRRKLTAIFKFGCARMIRCVSRNANITPKA